MVDIDEGATPLPEQEIRLELISRHAAHSVTSDAYPEINTPMEGEAQGGLRTSLPGPGVHPRTQRPDA